MTAPQDRTSDRPDLKPTAEPLNDEETRRAVSQLVVKRDFPQVERKFADPELPLQKVGLVSFIPAKGARPDSDGFFGFMKLRGNYASTDEADARAEHLIRNADSYHEILHVRVGLPFPVVSEREKIAVLADDDHQIDIKEKINTEMANEIREKRKKEKEAMNTIKEREDKLLDNNKKLIENDGIPETDDPDEHYTLLRSKRAQLIWTYLYQMKRVHKEIIPSILNATAEVRELDRDRPELKEECFRRFKAARDEVGIPDNDIQAGFIHYIIDDVSEKELREAYFGTDIPYELLKKSIVG